MKCSHLPCHETKSFSLVKLWRTTDYCIWRHVWAGNRVSTWGHLHAKQNTNKQKYILNAAWICNKVYSMTSLLWKSKLLCKVAVGVRKDIWGKWWGGFANVVGWSPRVTLARTLTLIDHGGEMLSVLSDPGRGWDGDPPLRWLFRDPILGLAFHPSPQTPLQPH